MEKRNIERKAYELSVGWNDNCRCRVRSIYGTDAVAYERGTGFGEGSSDTFHYHDRCYVFLDGSDGNSNRGRAD